MILLRNLLIMIITFLATVEHASATTFRFESNVDLSSFGGTPNGSLIVDWTFIPSEIGVTIDPPAAEPFKRYEGIQGTINIEGEIFNFNAGTIEVWNDRLSRWPDGFSLDAKNIDPTSSDPPEVQTMGQLLAVRGNHLRGVRFLLGGPSDILDSD